MDKIDSVKVTPLKKIEHSKGDIFHCMKETDLGYVGFGEAYFSTIRKNHIKGWNYHKEMTLNLIVPIGSVTFIIYDDKKKGNPNDAFFKVELSSSNYNRLTIPPMLWVAFKGGVNDVSLILNIANIIHDSQEIKKRDLNKIPYNFDSI
tara:strand:- start:209 stop:652 length:444 start_codon:yes stop_codon:yes gene_type:complete